MFKIIVLSLLLAILLFTNIAESFANKPTVHHPARTKSTMKKLNPPKAAKVPHIIQIHGEELIDNYFWLRDKNWPKVENSEILDYLKTENAYTTETLKDYKADYEMLYQEIVGRIKLEDSSVPIRKGNYHYYSRTEKDSDYPIYCRKYVAENAPEEIILNVNELAKNNSYFNLGEIQVSEDHHKLLYSADLLGSDRYTVQIKDLKTGEHFKDVVENTLGSVIWHQDGSGFFYSKLNDKWRTEAVYFHKLGDDLKNDVLLYKEQDPTYWVSLDQSGSKRFLFISTGSKTTNEIRYIDLTANPLKPVVIQSRHKEHLYDVDHHGDYFYIRTNDKGKNFRICTTSITQAEQANWKEFIPHHPNIYLEGFYLYQDHLALSSKENGLTKIKVINLNTQKEDILDFPDPTYDAKLLYTTFDANAVRISYSSLVTPDSTFEYTFSEKRLVPLKTLEIPSGYHKTLYQSERVFATSKDGVKIPISIVYKKDLFKKDGKNPLYLYGYGSYGHASSARFSRSILSLLDRGFVYAIAHIRGGDDMGYQWYESAKFLTKWNTFNDFIRAAEHLAQEKYTSNGNISIVGRSAGGMLVGVCINERPELYKAAIADVPFVDVLNTMLDNTLPLTPVEFTEWGNPQDLQYYQYIKSYSPYDNVKAQSYPDLYVTAGINDPRVTYWEPAKWVAKLRDMKKDDHLLLFNINMQSGHFGASGRFDYIKEIAKEYLFLLITHDLVKKET